VVKDGHDIELHPRQDVRAEAVEAVTRRLAWLLGARLVSTSVAEGPVLVVHVAAASRGTANAAVMAALQAMGTADLFVAGAAPAAGTGADAPLAV
jgi:hypothetical protein